MVKYAKQNRYTIFKWGTQIDPKIHLYFIFLTFDMFLLEYLCKEECN
jgi:hypothetical protein